MRPPHNGVFGGVQKTPVRSGWDRSGPGGLTCAIYPRNPVCVRRFILDPPVSVFSLSLYRHPFLYTLFTSRFTLIINNEII
jgi:hypothetical protein